MRRPVTPIHYLCKDGTDVTLYVQFEKRQNISFSYTGGVFLIKAPEFLTISLLQKTYLQDFAPSIEKCHKMHLDYLAKAAVPETIHFPLSGKTFSVKIDNTSERVREMGQDCPWFEMRFPHSKVFCHSLSDTVVLAGDIQNTIQNCYTLQSWVHDRAKELLPPYVHSLAKTHDLPLKNVTIRNQRRRWGSCSRQRDGTYNISLNWRSILMPVPLLNYLCLHELSHMYVMNHSEQFKNILHSLDLDIKLQEQELREFEKSLPWWAQYLDHLV